MTVITAELGKDAAFEELHDRDDHGRFSKMGAALHAIEQAFGKVTAHHASGSKHHDRPVVHVTGHADGDLALSAHDEEAGAFPFAYLDVDSSDLREALDVASDSARRGEDMQSLEGSLSVHAHGGRVKIINHDEDDELELSPDEADDLAEAVSRAGEDVERLSYPDYIAPLAEGEERVAGKIAAAEYGDFNTGMAAVDTPAGRVVRIGPVNKERRVGGYAGGRGPAITELDQEQAAQVAEALRGARTAGKDYESRYKEALRRIDELPAELTYHPQGYDTPAMKAIFDELAPEEEGVAAWFREVKGRHGTLRVEMRAAPGMETPYDLRLFSIPEGETYEDFNTRMTHSHFDIPESELTVGQAASVAKWLESAWKIEKSVTRGSVRYVITKSVQGGKPGSWEWQWKVGKLRKKWIGRPHPWTALERHLAHHMPAPLAKRTAAQWFKDVFGIWPGERKGKNPVGRG